MGLDKASILILTFDTRIFNVEIACHALNVTGLFYEYSFFVKYFSKNGDDKVVNRMTKIIEE